MIETFIKFNIYCNIFNQFSAKIVLLNKDKIKIGNQTHALSRNRATLNASRMIDQKLRRHFL